MKEAEDITIINLYAPNACASNVSAPNSIKHTPKDLKPHIEYNTMVAGDINPFYQE
jgi:hypothetical protein